MPGATDVELVGGRAPLRRITVGRRQPRQHEHALRDRLAAELDVLQRDPPRHLHRADVAQQFVDGVDVERRVGAQQLELVGVAHQLEDAGADQVHGGLVAGDEQQRHLVAQLHRRQAVAVLLGGDQRRQQVVGRVRPLPRDDLVDVRVHRLLAVDRRLDLLVGDDRVERLDDRSGPLGDLRLVGLGHPEHLGDHVERQREGQVGDDVTVAALGDRVEHLVDELLHPRSQRLDRRRRERLAHQPAQAGVVGWVDVEHARRPLEVLAGDAR